MLMTIKSLTDQYLIPATFSLIEIVGERQLEIEVSFNTDKAGTRECGLDVWQQWLSATEPGSDLPAGSRCSAVEVGGLESGSQRPCVSTWPQAAVNGLGSPIWGPVLEKPVA